MIALRLRGAGERTAIGRFCESNGVAVVARFDAAAGLYWVETETQVPDVVARIHWLRSAHADGVSLSLLTPEQWNLPAGRLVFDADSTLIEGEGIDLLAASARCEPEVSRATDAAMRGQVDFTESLRARVASLAGLRLSEVEAVIRSLRLAPGAPEAAAAARAAGWEIGIASGGFVPLVDEIARRIGGARVRANELGVRDGALDGTIRGGVVDAAAKRDFLLEEVPRSTVAIGDGANDSAMLAAATVGIAYRPKPALIDHADGVCCARDLRVALWLAGLTRARA